MKMKSNYKVMFDMHFGKDIPYLSFTAPKTKFSIKDFLQ